MDSERFRGKTYKTKYLCFGCRKVFKRRALTDLKEGAAHRDEEKPAKCPECGNVMTRTGAKLRVPPSHDVKAWRVLALMNELRFGGLHGHLYASADGGPYELPNGPVALRKELEKVVALYEANRLRLMSLDAAELRSGSLRAFGDWLARAKLFLRNT